MPWERPTLKTLHSRIAGDISARLLDGGPILSRSVLDVLAKVWAGACHGLHGFFAWLYLQVFPDTAEGEYLRRWTAVWEVHRKAASAATGTVRFTGQDGAVIPAGTLLLQRGTQQQYALVEDVAIITSQTGAAGVGMVVATVTGAAGNLSAGAELTLIAPVAGVTSIGVVPADSDGLSGGTDEETDDSLRARLLERLRKPPRGGSKADYERWAKEVPGVTRAWCYPLMLGIGTVGLCVVTDNAPAETGGPIPTAEVLRRVREHIDVLRPASMAELTVFAPETLDMTTRCTITPDTEALRLAVRDELADLFAREGEPGATIYRSHIQEAISLTADEIDSEVLLPARNVEVPAGVLPRLTAVEFVGQDGSVSSLPVHIAGGAA